MGNTGKEHPLTKANPKPVRTKPIRFDGPFEDRVRDSFKAPKPPKP